MFSGPLMLLLTLLNVEHFELRQTVADKLTADHHATTTAGLEKSVCNLMDSYMYIAAWLDLFFTLSL